MDQVDAPYVPIKQRKRTTFQQELDDKMRMRRKQGLTHELTSEESEEVDYDSEEENSLTQQFRSQLNPQRRDRPTSAKRRSESANETMTQKDAQRFMKKKPGAKESSAMPSLGRTAPNIEQSPRTSSQSEVDRMFGSSPKSRKSPIEERYGLSQTSPLDNKFGKTSTSPLDDRYGKTRTSPLDERFGKSSPSPLDDRYGKSRTSPLDERFGKSRASPVDSTMYEGHSRSSGGSSGAPSLLPKSVGKGDKSSGDRKSPLTKEMSKEDLIFGRKTPTHEDNYKGQEKKDWKAPSFRRGSPVLEEKPQSPAPSESGRGGRKTPLDLQTISENPKPAPRYRTDRSPTDQRMKSRDSSPRSLSLESPKAEKRAKPKVDIFGSKKGKEVDFEIEDEKEKRYSSARARRQSPTSRPTQQSGRTSPDKLGRTTPDKPGRFSKQPPSTTDRRTPTRFSDRRTPPIKDEQGDKGKPKKDVGLFDFLHEDSKPEKGEEKPKPRLRKDRPVQRESSMKKSVSHDSITDELLAEGEHPSMYEKSTMDMDTRHIVADQSSVCADLDNDPNRDMEREKDRAVRTASSSKQTRDRREADDIINRVTDAQTNPKQFKERPVSAKTNDKIHKPKPRHSLPGSVASDSSVEAFNSTTSIRQAIFEEWRKAKETETKKKIAEQKRLEKEKEDKKKKDEKDKLLEAKASYNAWMKQKEETFVKDQHRKKKEEEKKEQDKEQEKRQKEKDALKNFKKWKEQKDENLVDEHKKKVEEKHRKLQETKSLKKEKEKDNERAFIRWKEKKDKTLVNNDKKQKEDLRATYKMKVEEQRKKEQQAIDEYNEWMKKKEQQKEREAQMKRLRKLKEDTGDIDTFRPPWSPASKVIPCGR